MNDETRFGRNKPFGEMTAQESQAGVDAARARLGLVGTPEKISRAEVLEALIALSYRCSASTETLAIASVLAFLGSAIGEGDERELSDVVFEWGKARAAQKGWPTG